MPFPSVNTDHPRYLVGVSYEERYGVSWLTEKMPTYTIDEGLMRSTNYMWSCHFAMATMTTVGYGDVSPTNTAELMYTLGLLWLSLVVFSASLGILMNLITNMYEEGQERRNRLQQLAKYMNWRLLPREMKSSIRRYLNFVWETSEDIGEVEVSLMEKLSPTLRSKLCVHIFGNVLYNCPQRYFFDPRECRGLVGCPNSGRSVLAYIEAGFFN